MFTRVSVRTQFHVTETARIETKVDFGLDEQHVVRRQRGGVLHFEQIECRVGVITPEHASHRP